MEPSHFSQQSTATFLRSPAKKERTPTFITNSAKSLAERGIFLSLLAKVKVNYKYVFVSL